MAVQGARACSASSGVCVPSLPRSLIDCSSISDHTGIQSSNQVGLPLLTRCCTSGSGITVMTPRNHSWGLSNTAMTSASALHLLCLNGDAGPRARTCARTSANARGCPLRGDGRRCHCDCGYTWTIPIHGVYTPRCWLHPARCRGLHLQHGILRVRRHRHETTRAPISWCTSSSSLRIPPTAWPVLGLALPCS